MATDSVLVMDEAAYEAHLALHEGMQLAAWLKPIAMTEEQVFAHLHKHAGDPCLLNIYTEGGTPLARWRDIRYRLIDRTLRFDGPPFVTFAVATGTPDHSVLYLPGLPGFRHYPEWDVAVVTMGQTLSLPKLEYQFA